MRSSVAYTNVIEDNNDIKFGERSRVPGPANRIAALFANPDWIQNNEEAVSIFGAALASTGKDLSADRTIVSEEPCPEGPIGQLPPEILGEVRIGVIRAFKGVIIGQLLISIVGSVSGDGIHHAKKLV